MHNDDEYGFWADERDRPSTGPIPRLRRSTSRHGSTRSHGEPVQSVYDFESEQDTASGRQPSDSGDRDVEQAMWGTDDRPWRPSRTHDRRPIDPLIARLGAIAAVGLLALPVAWMVSRDGGSKVVSSNSIAGQTTETVVLAPAVVGATPAAVLPAEVATTAAMPTTAAEGAPSTAPTTVHAVATADTTPTSSAAASTPATLGKAPSAPELETMSSTPANEVAVVADDVEVTRVCANNYNVVAGDYWILIAGKVDLTLKEVLTANNATVDSPLYPGRTICLPWNASATTDAPSTTPAPATTATAAKPTASSAPPTTAAPATTAAPTTTEAPPKNIYSKDQVAQIIRDVWPDELEDEAIRIATRESNLIPTVRNWCCYGLFQIYFNANKASLASWGITSAAQLYDPKVNAYAAYAMYLRAGGWGPWQ
jgi:hypothetical protein